MKTVLITSILMAWLFISCEAPSTSEEAATTTFYPNPSGVQASLPYLIKGGNGNLYFSWIEKRDSGWIDLKYAVLQDDEWTSPEVIASGNDWFVNWADYPMIAADEAGNMMAHFLAKSSTGTYSYDVNVVSKPAGKSWSKAIVPHDDGTPTEHGFVTLLPNNDGTFLITWLDGRQMAGGDHDMHNEGMSGNAMTIRSAIMDMDGNLSAETALDERVCDCCQTGGVMTADGPVIVYRDRSENEIRDMSFVRWVNNEWSTPKTVYSDNWNIAGCPVNGPRIATNQQETAMAWFTAANGDAQVKAAFMDQDAFQSPVIIDDSVSVGRVDVVVLNDGTALVSWLDLQNETPLITCRTVTRDGQLGDPIVIAETSASRGSGFPQMELVGDQVYFAWTHIEENTTSIRMKSLAVQEIKP